MHHRQGHNGHSHIRSNMQEDPLQIWARFNDPMMRYGDVPGSALLMEQRILHPHDPHLAELHANIEQEQLSKAVLSGDPFWPNFPPQGALPAFTPGRIPIAALPTGDVLSIPILDATKNILIVGPTGGGKSYFLRIFIASFMEAL